MRTRVSDVAVLFYEMLNGHSPFEAEDHLATYQRILDGDINFPPKMDPQAVELIGLLLQKDISRRYGNLVGGATDIKEHAFYSKHGFNWSNIHQRGEAFKPKMFDPKAHEWVEASQVVTDAKPCKSADQALFDGF